MKQIPKPSNPEVTVIIPLYNGFEFLEGSLESTRRQTFKNWVGIVAVNGHGKTGEPVLSKVRALVASLGMSDVFDVINLPDIKGGAAAITKAAEIATTPFVAHLDCDDIWLPKKLETQMKLIDSDEEVGIVGTMCRYFGDSSDIPVLPTGELKKADFVKRNPMIHSSILIRRDLAVYTDEFVAYDYDCWVRNMLYGVKIVNIDNILVFHRVHMKSFYNASGKQDPDLVQKKYNLA
jgi:glycosyltransferase involved in cell wall biosynthesis